MILEHLRMGGPLFMSILYIMWIAVIFFILKFLVSYFSAKRDPKKLARNNSLILFIGSFAFLFGLLGQIIGIFGALDAIQAAGDISPALIAGGLKVSLIAPFYGFLLFLISFIVWFIYRNLIRE